jgi:hypothetical protein
MTSEWRVALPVAVVLAVAGCSKSEDLGLRLREECRSIVNTSLSVQPDFDKRSRDSQDRIADSLVSTCIRQRGGMRE